MLRLNTIRPLTAALFATFLLAPPLARADDALTANDGHLHIGLVNSPGVSLTSADIDRLAAEVGREGFLQKKATESDNPLAPCSLLAASVTGAMLNYLFYQTINGELTLPPRGTYIFGKYDWKSLLWMGRLPSDPETGADALARLTVIRSWAASATTAVRLSHLDQSRCLALLTDATTIPPIPNDPDSQAARMTHPAFVSIYFTTTGKTEGDALLAQLTTPELLASPASARANPLAPCSLLRSFRLAARLNDDWGRIGTGKFTVPDNALLANYPAKQDGQPGSDQASLPETSPLAPLADKLRDKDFLQGGSAQSAEVVARAFGHEMLRTNQLTEMLLDATQASQTDCLAEIREPSTLRLRLLEKKISLPLR